MIDYVVAHNPDDRVLKRASNILREGGLICFPTDTNWVACASPYHKAGVERLYRLRHLEDSKHLTVLCENFQKAMEVAIIDNPAFALMKKIIPGPYTFIFVSQKKITKWLKASKTDHQIGVRFCPTELSQALLREFGDVLICTHVTHDMVGEENTDVPLYSALIEEALGNSIEQIIDPGDYEFTGSTTIIDWTSGAPVVVREGAGAIDLFEKSL